ncbi:hypothetical protein BDF14DRAFT_1807257 [Spinellus fusiger]|nr:hypothetical protein BDF14DRAFT_1807257 [Spinellus fusiger]
MTIDGGISEENAYERLNALYTNVQEQLKSFIKKRWKDGKRAPRTWRSVSEADKEDIFEGIEEEAVHNGIPLNLCVKSWGARYVGQTQWVMARNAA